MHAIKDNYKKIQNILSLTTNMAIRFHDHDYLISTCRFSKLNRSLQAIHMSVLNCKQLSMQDYANTS